MAQEQEETKQYSFVTPLSLDVGSLASLSETSDLLVDISPRPLTPIELLSPCSNTSCSDTSLPSTPQALQAQPPRAYSTPVDSAHHRTASTVSKMAHSPFDQVQFACDAHNQRVGVMFAGLGGKTASSFWACRALRRLHQQRKSNPDECAVHGSLFMYADVPLLDGKRKSIRDMLFKRKLPNTIDSLVCVNGWDAKDTTLAEALASNDAIPPPILKLLQQFKPKEMETPIPIGVVYPEVLCGISDTLEARREANPDLDCIRLQNEIDRFARSHLLSFVVVGYCGTREMLSRGTLAPSQIYALAAARCRTRASFINFASQQTLIADICTEFDKRGRIALGDGLVAMQTRCQHSVLECFLQNGMPLVSAFSHTTSGHRQEEVSTEHLAHLVAPTLHTANDLVDSGQSYVFAQTMADNTRCSQDARFGLPLGHHFDVHVLASAPSTSMALGVMLDLILLSVILSFTSYSVSEDTSSESPGPYARSICCSQANDIASCFLQRSCSSDKRISNENRDVLTGFLCHLTKHVPETYRHLSLFQR